VNDAPALSEADMGIAIGAGGSEGLLVAKWLVAHKIDVALVKQSLDGRGPGYVLRDAGVVLRESDKETLAEVIASQRSALKVTNQ
jgi:magnesium-transporting ATPase (P-type)